MPPTPFKSIHRDMYCGLGSNLCLHLKNQFQSKTLNSWLPVHHFGSLGPQCGTRGHPKGDQCAKEHFLAVSPAPIWAPILTHFSRRVRTSANVTAFLGDLEATHMCSRNFVETGEPRSLKMLLKHSKYAVGCKVGFSQKKSSKWAPGAPFWRPLGVTLEHFGHPRGHFLRS